jgi:hypothetical protein
MQENTPFQEQNLPPAPNPAPDAPQDLVRLFIGKNADYFIGKWATSPNTLNIAAFFFGPAWLLYRKMFWHGGLILAALVIETMAEWTLFPDMSEDSSALLARSIGIGVAVLIGLSGNGWYKGHVDRAVARLRASGASAESYRSQGGTSWLAVILGILGFFALMMLGSGVLTPDDY